MGSHSPAERQIKAVVSSCQRIPTILVEIHRLDFSPNAIAFTTPSNPLKYNATPSVEITPPASSSDHLAAQGHNNLYSTQKSHRMPTDEIKGSVGDPTIDGPVNFLLSLVVEPKVPSQRTKDGNGSDDESIGHRSAHDDSTISPPPSSNTAPQQTGPVQQVNDKIDGWLLYHINYMIRDIMVYKDQLGNLAGGTSLSQFRESTHGQRLIAELERLLAVIGKQSPVVWLVTEEMSTACKSLYRFINNRYPEGYLRPVLPQTLAYSSTSQLAQTGRPSYSAPRDGPSAQGYGSQPPFQAAANPQTGTTFSDFRYFSPPNQPASSAQAGSSLQNSRYPPRPR